MKKALIIIVVLVLLGLGGGLYYLFSNLDAIVARAIEKYGSQATQTEVRVDGVSIRLGEGSATIEGLSIGNPEGFATENVFELGSINVAIDINSIMDDTIVFNNIAIRQPRVFFEINDEGRNNLTLIKDNLAGPAPEEEQQTSEMPDLLIRNFLFSDASLHAEIVPVGRSYDLNLAALTLTDIGGPDGAQPGQIARDLLNRLVNHVQERVRQEGLDQVKEQVKQELDRMRGDVETRKQEVMEESGKKLDAEKEKLQEGLKGLFDR